MCGIAGIIAANHRDVIRPMPRAMEHRGPDGEGYDEDDAIALGRLRLSIIDLESGKQPIPNEEGNLRLVCNGEIYNSPELRETLTTRGHRFRIHSDVEVILHLYKEHGIDCVRYLCGMFVFPSVCRSPPLLLQGRPIVSIITSLPYKYNFP
jgi:asparagine synthase (glutamine-hydrolysing)